MLEEDAQGVAVSSYQGGHVEYFEYLAQLLAEAGAGHVRIFGGGGGVIVPDEIARLAAAGVRIFSPEDGQRLGLPGMINELIRDCDTDLADRPAAAEAVLAGDRRALARAITCLQARPPAGRGPCRAGRGRGVPPGARARHHRHRRLRQVVADRRAGPPAAHRPAGQAAGGGAGGRPDPAARPAARCSATGSG